MYSRILFLSVLVLTFPASAFCGNQAREQAEKSVERFSEELDATSERLAEKLAESDIKSEELKTLVQEDLKTLLIKGYKDVKRLEQELKNEQRRLEKQRDRAEKELAMVQESHDTLQRLNKELGVKYSTAKWVQAALGSGYLFAFAGLAMQFLMHKRSDRLNELKAEELSRRLQSNESDNGEQ